VSRPLQLTSWDLELKSRFPDLPARTVFVLALYSFGMILAKVSGLSSVALFLGKSLTLPYHALRKRLSEFYKEAKAKSGASHGVKRTDFEVTSCFAPLLRWALSLWSGKHLPLAIDVTNLGERFHVLCVSVVVGGVAIPVAWKVLLGGVKDPWNPHWQDLLRQLKRAVPGDWTVVVLSDRGLESAELFRFIVGLGWHPLMRAKKGGKFKPKGWGNFYHFDRLVRQVGGSFHAEGAAYAQEKLRCTLLARWDEGYAEPWLILTDLPPEAADAVWYGLRTWIEQGFKVIKGGGWDWQKTRMEDPQRVERLWLVLAVATLWVVAVGADDEAREEADRQQKELQRRMSEGDFQARQREAREQQRLSKLREAQQGRAAREGARKKAKEEARQAKEEARQAKKQGKQEQGDKQEASERAGKKAGQTKRQKQRAGSGRTHRLSARGLAELKACWDGGKTLLPRHLHPEPWPQPCHSASTLTEADFLAQQT
jgi:hypothetical protein